MGISLLWLLGGHTLARITPQASDAGHFRWRRDALERVCEGDHLPALVGIWQGPAHGAQIVRHMPRIGGAWDDCGHSWVAEQIFEEELRPRISKTARPIRKFLTAHGAEQPGAAERQCRQHAGLDLSRRRQDALFDF